MQKLDAELAVSIAESYLRSGSWTRRMTRYFDEQNRNITYFQRRGPVTRSTTRAMNAIYHHAGADPSNLINERASTSNMINHRAGPTNIINYGAGPSTIINYGAALVI